MAAMLPQRRVGAFSLIEAAIVLAVVGIVLGGIWVAASRVGEQYRAAQTAADLVQIHTGLRHLYHQQWPTVSTDVTGVVISAGLAPPDLRAGAEVLTRYPGFVMNFYVLPQYVVSNIYAPAYDKLLTKRECIALVQALTRNPKIDNLTTSDANWMNASLMAFPATFSQIANVCADIGTIVINIVTRP